MTYKKDDMIGYNIEYYMLTVLLDTVLLDTRYPI